MVGWTNLDRLPLDGVDVVFDLEACFAMHLPFAPDSVSEIVGVDLIEHVAHPLELMGELHRVAAPGALCTWILPYGSSDDAWEDPTHVRPYFIGSWRYFAQPIYYRADYGYRGDWDIEEIALDLPAHYRGTSPDVVLADVMTLRNVVLRQTVILRAVKPARPCDPALLSPPPVRFVFAKEEG